MTIERYYVLINSGIGRKLKEIINGWIPVLIKEPVPVRVPVRRMYRENRK
ncbi:hypothetical protein OCV51_02580 [Faecalicatena acetigenes]|uniref:Uncharacterized protein n=1 Tax=Faecalicatena acetigenes TaxID=2981790 RepID=A0ABT2T8F9_9FIRM|nr:MULTISPECIES: hypothetical protein [Lachnospiraceae]MCU6746553.1 hypothetical protein [Faecalicatena acetigenes]SCH24294.1 Uncharacterised protein [uncultured Clostridium sp.]